MNKSQVDAHFHTLVYHHHPGLVAIVPEAI